MKIVERLLLKLIIIQFVFLLLTQVFFHKLNSFPELQQLAQYEGVSENDLTEFLETFSSK
ncbi:YpfB family protein [Niallia oryzisoli]|uniref:YpfB family protein n=1 Tax=Niallia oryzisoli TaxID=1737571 RepID=A0ABZ2CKP6_9BACI